MYEPISVSIKNNARGRALTWLGKGSVWVGEKATVTVNYEPWSCADRNQRIRMLAELSNNQVELTLHVITPAGQVDLKYNPHLAFASTSKPITVQAPAPVHQVQAAVRDISQDQNNHIVVAGAHRVNELGMGFKATVVTPPSAEHVDMPREGFAVTQVGVGMEHTVTPESAGQLKTAEEVPAEGVNEAAGEAKNEVASTAENEAAELSMSDTFNALCAAKKWAEALQLLIDKFGEEKVTFTTRTIMAMRDYDAVVKKYNLE